MGPDPAVAAVRLAVRRLGLDAGTVVVACSGGPDSLALLTATVFEARHAGWSVVGATVDHGLQDGSADRAARVVEQMADLGAHETLAVRGSVERGRAGPEAAAREARYAVLGEVARRWGASAVLLGHTQDDQAETVLLGLTRGSGGRSIAGMRPAFDVYRRPLLEVTRAQTEAACRAQGIEFWRDPHNQDPRFTRARVRGTVLPVLERELGPGVAVTLARTGELLRDDLDALDRLAERALPPGDAPDVAELAGLEPAVATRVLRLAALRAGAPADELFRVHVVALAALVAGEVRGEVQLPGRVTAYVEASTLRFRPTAVAG